MEILDRNEYNIIHKKSNSLNDLFFSDDFFRNLRKQYAGFGNFITELENNEYDTFIITHYGQLKGIAIVNEEKREDRLRLYECNTGSRMYKIRIFKTEIKGTGTLLLEKIKNIANDGNGNELVITTSSPEMKDFLIKKGFNEIKELETDSNLTENLYKYYL